MWLKRKKMHVGLDIGSYSLKIMEVLAYKGKPVLEKVCVHELPVASEQNLSGDLKSLLEDVKLSTKKVNISVSGSGVVVRFIELPLMQDSELSQSLPFEAEKHIPLDIKEMTLEHIVLERNQAEKKIKVLLVAAKKGFIEKYKKLLTDLGFAPNIIDVDSFAIFNSFIKSVPKDERGNKTIALLNIGAHVTNAIIARDDIPLMVRDIDFGGINFTQVLQEQLKIEAEEARRLKHDPKERSEEVLGALGGVFQDLAEKIKLSFTYYENQGGKGIDEVYVSGGSIKLNGLVSFLKENIGLKVEQWDPLKPFEVNSRIPKETLENFGSSLAVCSGLALRE